MVLPDKIRKYLKLIFERAYIIFDTNPLQKVPGIA
jgi:hypothetical protein